MRHIRLPYYRRFSGTEDTGFLPADTFAIRSQPVGMIESDAGNHGDIGIHDISGVETAAEPHLQDHHIQLRLLKQP